MNAEPPLPPPPAPDNYEHADTGAVRHANTGEASRSRTIARLAAIGLVVVLVAAAALAGIAIWSLSDRFQKGSVNIAEEGEPQVEPLEGAFAVLVVGVDNAPGQSGEYGDRDSTLNDVNVLLHVSEDHKSATAVSLPRDLVVDHPPCRHPETGLIAPAETARLNKAMSRGGLACVVQTAEKLTGIDIPYAALLTFRAVIEMTDAVGGVPVCLAEPIDDPKTGLDLSAGEHVIAGEDALAFLRSRYGVGNGSDLARISSQQVYFASLARELKSEETFSNIGRLYRLANVAADHARVSSSLAGLDTMVAMAMAFRDVSLDQMAFVQYPVQWDPTNPNQVIPVPELAEELFDTIVAGEPVVLPGDATGPGSTLDPDDPGESEGGEPTPTPAPTETPPPIQGLQGQMADQESCTVANAG